MRRLHQTLTCAALLTLGLTGQSQAGFFDFLFGGQQQLGNQRPVYVPGYAPARPLPRVKDHDRIRRASASADGDPQKNAREATLANIRKLDAVAKTEGVKAAFLKDQTVRPGDILVTSEGLAVYERGRDGGQIRPLAESRYKDRTDLQMLQKVGKANPVRNPDLSTREASNEETPRNVRTADVSNGNLDGR
ncbi:hypothetical protein PY365_28020 [Roseiarcaceae bacterium H3SJ34-1]|uniref:hypothetical protein n=1 Tax=Terripilifer ovatus TaxID=3032367 RepID=UPI003AB94807|nr:hypothetical protein [Roseiarcaceae bacterium H3SJ34-1]